MRVDWQDLSRRRLKEARKRVAACESVFGGFNLLLDRIKQPTAKELEQLIITTGTDLSDCLATPKRHTAIRTKRDLTELLVTCIASGESKEVPVVERDVCEWLNGTWAKSCMLKVGGQPAHMALAACAIVPKIILGGWPTPARFAELMPQEGDNIHLVVSNLDKMHVKPLHECRDLLRHDFANCAIDFSEKLTICIGSDRLNCPKPGRFIANCYPRQDWMKSGTSNQLKLSGARATHAFLSGCQSLCPEFNKGLWPTQVLEFAAAVRGLRDESGCQAVHYEMGTIQSEALLGKLVKELLPEVDSVGCNDDELVQILEAIGKKELALQIKKEKSIESMYLGASHLVQRCDLRRLHVHTWDFHVSVSKVGNETHVAERDALLFGAVMGAAKTYTELDIKDIHITRGLEIPFSEDGLKQVNELHQDPGRVGACIAHGSFKTDDALVCVVPGRVKKAIDSTVGLGDTLSSMAFLAAAG